jgi:hypothetical protein
MPAVHLQGGQQPTGLAYGPLKVLSATGQHQLLEMTRAKRASPLRAPTKGPAAHVGMAQGTRKRVRDQSSSALQLLHCALEDP